MTSRLLERGRDHATPEPDVGARLRRVAVAVPDRLVLIFLWTVLVVGLTTLFSVFYPLLVIALVAALTALTWRLAPAPVAADQRTVIGSALALLGATAWALLNRHYDAQLLSIVRDPAVYTLRGWWLMHHHSPNLPVGGSLNAASAVPGASFQATGFPYTHGSLHPQGNSLLPGLLALAGWLGGGRLLLVANLAVGALALLAVYAFARRLMGPIWALAPMAALAASMPMLYFSRAPYTEPAALLVTFGGCTALHSAWRNRSPVQFGLAGLFFGAGQIARIDGAVAVIGVSLSIGLSAVLAREEHVRVQGRRFLLAFATAAFFMMGIGTVDLVWNSPAYAEGQKMRLVPLLVAGAAVVAALWLLSRFRPPTALAQWLAARQRLVARVAGWSCAAACALMASRPLWWRSHFEHDATVVLALQRRAGVSPDPARSYDEQSLRWLSWYVGWPVLALAATGLVWMLVSGMRRRDPAVLGFLSMVLVVGALYLNDVSITPDQIWATRRFLPVILPGMLVAAAWAVARCARRAPVLTPVAALAGVGIVVLPMLAWGSVVTTGEQAGERDEVLSACRAVRGHNVVITGALPASGNYLPSVRVVCGNPALYIRQPSAQALATLRRDWGGALDVLTFQRDSVPWASAPAVPVHTGSYPTWETPLLHRPSTVNRERRSLWAGEVGPDGTVVPR